MVATFIKVEDVDTYKVRRIHYDVDQCVCWAVLESSNEELSTIKVKIDDYSAKFKICSALEPFVTCSCESTKQMTTPVADAHISNLALKAFHNIKALMKGVKNV